MRISARIEIGENDPLFSHSSTSNPTVVLTILFNVELHSDAYRLVDLDISGDMLLKTVRTLIFEDDAVISAGPTEILLAANQISIEDWH